MVGWFMDSVAQMKAMVGKASAAMVESGMALGFGSGSTAEYMIKEVGGRWQRGELKGIRVVCTSFQSSALAQEFGIPQQALNEIDRIDLGIDGADEVDARLDLIKGGGGCQTREKLVDSRVERLVIVVDSSKMVEFLGSTMPVPVEVIPDAYRQVAAKLRDLDGAPQLRMAVKKAGPVVTDEGNLILDTRFTSIDEPAEMEATINNIPGVLENGLFLNMADEVLIGHVDPDGSAHVETRKRP
jgi:ribose 5-phosphate isomerase A